MYLPENANAWLVERFKLPGYKQEKEKEKKERKERVPAKRKAPAAKTNGHTKYAICTLIPSMYSLLIPLFRRARRKRNVSDDDEDDDGASSDVVAEDDSDVEMADARPTKQRKSDVSEGGKQTRAERLSARTQAKVCTTRRFPNYC